LYISFSHTDVSDGRVASRNECSTIHRTKKWVIQWGIERLTLLSNAKEVKVKTCEKPTTRLRGEGHEGRESGAASVDLLYWCNEYQSLAQSLTYILPSARLPSVAHSPEHTLTS